MAKVEAGEIIEDCNINDEVKDFLGEGNGNPYQYSCLEYPGDRGAWWAAVYGVTHSWT